MDSEAVLEASVDELMAVFRESLVALIPTADRLVMPWGEQYQHQDWELLAQTLFQVCVEHPLTTDAHWTGRGRAFPLASYDINVGDYRKLSWISPGERYTAVIRLRSVKEPFDSVEAVRIDPGSLIPAPQTEVVPLGATAFSWVRRAPGQDPVVVDRVVSDE